MAVSIYFVIQDAKNETSTTEFFFDDATAWAVIQAGVGAIGALINPLVTGGLRAAGIRVEVDISGVWGTVAQLTSDVQEKAEFAMRTANGFLSRLNLPTFDEAFFVPNSAQVDLTDPDVVAFIDFLEDGITAGGGSLEPTDYREDDIADVVRATENWGRRRPAR